SDSDAWKTVCETAKQLVWSVSAPMDKANRQQLLKLVPRLLPQLRSGLESIAYNPYSMTQLFKKLESLHLTRLRAQPANAEIPVETVIAEPRPSEAATPPAIDTHAEALTAPVPVPDE